MDSDASLQAARYYLDRDASEVEVLALAGGIAAVYSRRHPFKATSNEDAAVLIPLPEARGVVAVADGCGGMAGGEHAARLAVHVLADHVQRISEQPVSLRSAILDGMETANCSVRELGTGAATTLAVVEIENGSVRSYHVGDTSILLIGNRGKIKLKTMSHSPVGYAVQAGILDEQDAIHHEERHVVSNVIGSVDTHIEIGPRRLLAARDTLILASDGLTDNLHTDEIIEIARKGPIEVATRRLAEIASQRMNDAPLDTPSKPDDLTLILFRRQPAKHHEVGAPAEVRAADASRAGPTA